MGNSMKYRHSNDRSDKAEDNQSHIVEYITEVAPPPAGISLLYGGGGDIKIVCKSGRTYYFKAGVPTEVDPNDANELLSMSKTAGCCGKKYTVNLFGRA